MAWEVKVLLKVGSPYPKELTNSLPPVGVKPDCKGKIQDARQC
jgi:hypothetical protein